MNEHGNIVIYKDKYGCDNIEVTIRGWFCMVKSRTISKTIQF